MEKFKEKIIKIWKDILSFLCRLLRIKRFNTATEILLKLKEINYTEPFFDETKWYGDILTTLETRYEQIMVDKALNLIDEKTFNRLLKEWKGEFELYRENYIHRLGVVRI